MYGSPCAVLGSRVSVQVIGGWIQCYVIRGPVCDRVQDLFCAPRSGSVRKGRDLERDPTSPCACGVEPDVGCDLLAMWPALPTTASGALLAMWPALPTTASGALLAMWPALPTTASGALLAMRPALPTMASGPTMAQDVCRLLGHVVSRCEGGCRDGRVPSRADPTTW
jgi:hypothetical protein